MNQTIINGKGAADKVEGILSELNCKKFLLVCDNSFEFLNIKDTISSISVPYISFSDFTPNPVYEDVVKGVELFNAENCEAIVAVGGGSGIDTAKCIKLFSKMDKSENFLNQKFKDTGIPLIAVPTTAGTGSESTRYAVIYFEGKKQSVTHESIVPDFAILDSNVLLTLPEYQKKCTLLDALCQGIESWWSVNSTEESREISKAAVELIVKNLDEYINKSTSQSCENIMTASNKAGQAINITQTTAAHAMSYKLTSLYKIPHGHAAAVCLPEVWEFMSKNLSLCIDKRGEKYLADVFLQISKALGSDSIEGGIEAFKNILKHLDMADPKAENRAEELNILTKSVNPVRLGNNPVALSEEVLFGLYERIVK